MKHPHHQPIQDRMNHPQSKNRFPILHWENIFVERMEVPISDEQRLWKTELDSAHPLYHHLH